MMGPEQKTSKTKQHPPSLSIEERFRLLSESLTDYAFITFDQENRITSWSAGAEKLLGWSEDEVLGESGAIFFTPEDRERGEVEKEIDQALHYGRAEDDRWHMRKDGSRFWASGVMTAVGDESGRHLAFAKVLRDLTERERAEAVLRERRRSSVRPWR
jgi:PAS domain S-box-containing protein